MSDASLLPPGVAKIFPSGNIVTHFDIARERWWRSKLKAAKVRAIVEEGLRDGRL